MTPDEIAILQKRLRLNRAQFARVLDISAPRLDSYKGHRDIKPDIPRVMIDRLETLARLVDVIRSD